MQLKLGRIVLKYKPCNDLPEDCSRQLQHLFFKQAPFTRQCCAWQDLDRQVVDNLVEKVAILKAAWCQEAGLHLSIDLSQNTCRKMFV